MKFTVGAGIKFGLGLAIGMAAFEILDHIGGSIYGGVRRIWNEENGESYVEDIDPDETVDLPRKRI